MDKWLETKHLPAHLISASGLICKDGKILLFRSEHCGWKFPGGFIEQGESILEGVKREILEETGISAEPGQAYRDLSKYFDERRLRPAGRNFPAPGGDFFFPVQLCQRRSDAERRLS